MPKPENLGSQGKPGTLPTCSLKPLTFALAFFLWLSPLLFFLLLLFVFQDTQHIISVSLQHYGSPQQQWRWQGNSPGQADSNNLGDSWHCPLGNDGNAISYHAFGQGVSLSLILLLLLYLSHCSMWNIPLHFSFPLYLHNKLSFSILISTPF